jgi:hypothetical protein
MTLRHAAFASCALFFAACGGSYGGQPERGTGPATASGSDAVYYVYVGAESADLIHRIRFGPDGVTVDQTTPVGELAVETEGPHGLNVSPDGKYLYRRQAVEVRGRPGHAGGGTDSFGQLPGHAGSHA